MIPSPQSLSYEVQAGLSLPTPFAPVPTSVTFLPQACSKQSVPETGLALLGTKGSADKSRHVSRLFLTSPAS
jgi:hypothetical protein